MTNQNVLDALSKVIEPDLKKDLVSLNMIRDLVLDGNKISFTIMLTTPACPMKEKMEKDCREALLSINPDAEIHISMTAEVSSSRSAVNILPNVKNILLVSSGKGGVGKSAVTVGLAKHLHRKGAKVGVLDADILGPSIPTLFGIKQLKPKVREIKDKLYILPIEIAEDFKVLSIGFLVDEQQAIVWRGPMLTSALNQFVKDVLWGDLDYLIVDMPPGTGDVQITLSQMLQVTGAIIVSTPSEVAIADVKKAITMYAIEGIGVPVLGLVENMSYFIAPETGEKHYVFGKDTTSQIAKSYDLPVFAQIPLSSSWRASLDSGKFFDAEVTDIDKVLEEMTQNIAQEVSIHNQKKLDKT